MTAPPPRPDPVEVALPRPTAAWLVAVLGVIVERGHDIVEDGSGLRARGHAAAVLDWLGRMDDLTADRDRLATALEATAAELGDAVVRITELEAGLEAERQRHRETYASHVDLSERLLDARERIAKLEAGLRRMTNPHGPADGTWYRQAARDLLADATFREIVSTDAKREVRP
jgi:hypothetical protein